MANKTIINGIYALDYFDLPNVKRPPRPSDLWWSSRERFSLENGLTTTEYIEIDLGRRRQVNFISFDIIKKPVDITIEYDSASFDDKIHTWLPVTPLSDRSAEHPGRAYDPDIPFDDRVDFESTAVNMWRHLEFYFTDASGDMLTTRFIRIGFSRRNQPWPLDTTGDFRWSIDVTNTRVARYILDYQDTKGIILEVDNNDPDFFIDTRDYVEVRQSFTMPFGYTRGDQAFVAPRDQVVTPIYPRIMGFGFLVDIVIPPGVTELVDVDLQGVVFDWSIWDYTGSSPVNLGSGEINGASNTGRCWVDAFFKHPITTTPATKMQFRVSSRNKSLCKTFFTWEPNIVASSVDTDMYGVQTAGAETFVTRFDNTSLVYRVWGDVGESGEDILGNSYRYGTRLDEAENVLDSNIGSQWVSQANPSPSAVECLYFDVRHEDGNVVVPSVIDSIRVDPLFDGPYMHVYYSNESNTGAAPTDVKDWESLLWTPVLEDYVLEKNQIFELPTPIRASWICLEFTRLQPMPYTIPTYPKLPAVQYKRHPSWVIDDFAAASTTDSSENKKFIGSVTALGNRQVVELDILGTYRQTAEFLYRAKIISDYPNQEATTITGVTSSNLDPTTMAKIMYTTSQDKNSTVSNVSYDSLLASVVADRFKNNSGQYISEQPPTNTRSGVTSVSTPGNRDENALAYLANEKLYFNLTCEHKYAIEKGEFGTKAYFVGINEIEFFRKDYTARHDDEVIRDILADPSLINSPLIEYNNWELEVPTTIPAGQAVYVSYQINDIEYVDDVIQFEQGEVFDFTPVPLTYSGARARAIQVFSGANGTGQQYIIGKDVDIIYDPILKTNSIRRNSQHFRLVPARIDSTYDSAVVVGRSKIASLDSTFVIVDSGTVTGVAVPSGFEI